MTPLLFLVLDLLVAHPLEPAHVRIDIGPDHLELTLSHARDAVRPTFAAPCHVDLLPAESTERLVVRERWACVPDTLTLIAAHRDPPVIVELRSLRLPGEIHTDTRTTLLDATSPTLSLRDDAPSFWAWLWLGAEHLWGGLDHVLLVLGLVLLIGFRRQLVFALTAFTLGHSASLALGATGLVTLPSALVESAIAATLVLLALDLVTQRTRRPPSLFATAPWLTGLGVGLIHGLGFAGVLADLGLPEDHTAMALIAFNLGLEAAQLALVAALFALALAGRPILPRLRPAPLGGWLIGVLGAAWLLERALPL